MKFIKAGEIADSNIFNKLDERKKSLLEGGMDVINLSIGTPDFQPGKHVMEPSAALHSTRICTSIR